MTEETIEVVIKAKNLTDVEKEYHLNRAVEAFQKAWEECPSVVKFVGTKSIKKIIYVPDKILNIIV